MESLNIYLEKIKNNFIDKYNLDIEIDEVLLIEGSNDLDKMQNNKIHVLTQDINLYGKAIKPKNNIKSIIDLNGHQITQQAYSDDTRAQCILLEEPNTKLIIIDSSDEDKGKIISDVSGYATIEVKYYADDSLVFIAGGVSIETYRDFALNNNSNFLEEKGFILTDCNVISNGQYKAIPHIENVGEVLIFAMEGHGVLCSDDIKKIEYQ